MIGTVKAKELKIYPCEIKEIRDFVEKYHYSHNVNGVKTSYCFGIKHNDELIGAIIFGGLSTTAWKKFAKKENKVLELRRLVLLDVAGKNSESRVVGLAIKWIRKHDKDIEIIVSYADPAFGHSGTIYKASNFKHIGLTYKDKGFKDPATGKIYHSRALRTKYKGEYKPFVKRLRKLKEEGKLVEIDLPGKHCYVYYLL